MKQSNKKTSTPDLTGLENFPYNLNFCLFKPIHQESCPDLVIL